MENSSIIENLHRVQYDTLLEFDRVCQKYGLTYFLAYGTLLGAVRHNGFIPWDDDIDTLMPYDDYKKLQSIPVEEWRTPYFLQSYDTDPHYRLCYTKLRNSNTTLITEGLAHMDINQGVDIDIYPLIHLADDPQNRKKQYRRTMLYMLLRVNEPPRNHGKIYYYGGKALLKLIPERVRQSVLQKLKTHILSFQSVASKNSYVVNGNIEVMRQVLNTEWFSEPVYHKFESQEFPIPVGAREWLETRYGKSYMQLPPKELQGIKLDQFVKIDLKNSYQIYKGLYYCNQASKKKKVENNRWVNYS